MFIYVCVILFTAGEGGMADPIATRPPGPDSSWDQTGNDIKPPDPLPPEMALDQTWSDIILSRTWDQKRSGIIPRNHKNGRYTSNWNDFLLIV